MKPLSSSSESDPQSSLESVSSLYSSSLSLCSEASCCCCCSPSGIQMGSRFGGWEFASSEAWSKKFSCPKSKRDCHWATPPSSSQLSTVIDGNCCEIIVVNDVILRANGPSCQIHYVANSGCVIIGNPKIHSHSCSWLPFRKSFSILKAWVEYEDRATPCMQLPEAIKGW